MYDDKRETEYFRKRKGGHFVKKSVKKALIGSGLAVGTLVAAGAWSYAITRKLVEIALDRKEDKTVEGRFSQPYNLL